MGDPAKIKSKATAESKEIFCDLGFSAPEARDVVSLVKQVSENPPDEATQASWQKEAWADLVRSSGGENGARESLGLAKKLLNRDPRTKQIVLSLGLGNNPRIVKLMVEKARAERARGRL
jgi:hypothetical protein